LSSSQVDFVDKRLDHRDTRRRVRDSAGRREQAGRRWAPNFRTS